MRMVFLFEQPSGGPTVGANSGIGVAGLDEDLRFIAGDAGRYILAGLDQDAGRDGTPQVSARQDGRTAPAIAHALRQIIHHGRLSRASHADAAYAHDRRVEMPRPSLIPVATPAAEGRPQLREQPQHRLDWPLRDGPGNG